jgi:hypothetical protein
VDPNKESSIGGQENPRPPNAFSADHVKVSVVNQTSPQSPSSENSIENRRDSRLEWTKAVALPLVTVLVTVVGGYYFTTLSKVREARESNDHLFAQLLTQREQSDAQIRKDMFQVVITNFLKDTNPEDWSNKVLQLELLANNFNQSLDLAPLFKDLARRLAQSASLPGNQGTDLRKRLDRTAATLIFKQVNSLGRRGYIAEETFPIAAWEKSFGKPLIDETIPKSRLVASTNSAPGIPDEQIHFAVEVVDVNIEEREIEVRLRVYFSGESAQDVDRHFWVGQYDFPMLDNTQLSNGLRTSVVITDFFVPDEELDREANSFVKLHLVVFPAASASFKERQDYDDILLDKLAAEGRKEGGQP